jgi:hypothetical protein
LCRGCLGGEGVAGNEIVTGVLAGSIRPEGMSRVEWDGKGTWRHTGTTIYISIPDVVGH